VLTLTESRLAKGVYVVILRTCAENGRIPYWGVENFGLMVCLGFETKFGEGPPTLEELRSVP